MFGPDRIVAIHIYYNLESSGVLRLSGQVVRRRSRKPKIAGSIPVWASHLKFCSIFFLLLIASCILYTMYNDENNTYTK